MISFRKHELPKSIILMLYVSSYSRRIFSGFRSQWMILKFPMLLVQNFRNFKICLTICFIVCISNFSTHLRWYKLFPKSSNTMKNQFSNENDRRYLTTKLGFSTESLELQNLRISISFFHSFKNLDLLFITFRHTSFFNS